MIWTIFWINIFTIAISFKKRMILYALMNAIFLYLVTGQAFQIQADLELSGSVQYLFHYINGAGFNLALWYVLGISCVSLALALISRGYIRGTRPKPLYTFAPSRRFYILLFIFLFLLSSILIFWLVGISEFLNSTRPGIQSGSTSFIVLLIVGVMPFLLKVLTKSKIERGDIICFLFSFVITAAFSRINVIVYLTAILLVYYYASGWADRPISMRLLARLLLIGSITVVMFFGVGAIRSAQSFTGGSFGSLISYLIEHPENSLLSLEFNYRFGIEGMSGITGAFTQYLWDPSSVHYDYGASWMIRGIIQWLPGFLKTYAYPLSLLSYSLNWYPNSIVASGAEKMYVSYGWFATLLYPIAVYLLGWVLPLKMLAKRTSPLILLCGYTFLACCIFFVRGSLDVWIAFSFSYVIIILLFWPLFRRQLHRIDKRPEISRGHS